MHLDDYRRLNNLSTAPTADILYANAKKEFDRHIRPLLTRLLLVNGFSEREVKTVASKLCECYIQSRLEKIKGVV